MTTQTKDLKQQKHYRACHLCEAICGLEIVTTGDQVISIKGDDNDPVSHGFICPKATAIADIHTDPDRLRMPVKRDGNEWKEISWEEAIDFTAKKLVASQQSYGNDSVAFFAGNPGVHNYGNLTHGPALRRALQTKNHFSATSLDQLPHQLAAYTMYGHQFFLPIPDIDHTQLMLILGGNPLASNGSMMTVPNAPKRIKALQARGGKLVVIDPRRSETAAVSDEHLFVKPGTDAFLLMALIKILFDENLINLGHLKNFIEGIEAVKLACQPYSIELAEQQTGISAKTIKRLAHELASTDKAVVYGRMGVSTQEFGGICQWAIQVLNILIGALDSQGGALLTSPAFAYVEKGTGGAGHFDRHRSRVSGLPEFSGELPAACLAEEILTEGEGKIRSMVTIAANPLISSTNSSQLEGAFESLDFFVAIDFYINATTRHADIILPPTSPLEHDHYDIAFLRLAVHNSTRYNAAIFETPADALHDWEIFNALTQKICDLNNQEFHPLPAPDKIIKSGIESGHYGKQNKPEIALTFEKIKQAQHGVDLGPLRSGLTERLCTKSGAINLAPDIYLNDLPRLFDSANQPDDNTLLLIGRRHIRSNNSWMHNYHRLVKGKPRWQLMMHPEDCESRGIPDQSQVIVESQVGAVTTTVIATEEMMPGVVSLPHGWGHSKPGIKMHVASQQLGVNCNELTDDKFIDKLSGNAALNGVPVSVSLASER